MAHERELQLLSNDRAKLMSYEDSVLNKYKQITIWWPDEDDQYAERLVSFLYVYGHPSNYPTTGRFYVDQAEAGGPFLSSKKIWPGRWRFVGAIKQSNDNEGMTEAMPGVLATYRFGFASTLENSETRLRGVLVDPIFQKRLLTTEWQNIDPQSVKTLIDTETARLPTTLISNPIIDGQTFTGSFAVSSVSDDLSEEGTGLIRRRLTEVSVITTVANLQALLHQETYSKERIHPFSSSSVYLPAIDSFTKDVFILRWKYLSRSSLTYLQGLTAANLSVFAPDATWAVAMSTPIEQDDNTIWFEVAFQKEERDIDVDTYTARTDFSADTTDETLIDQADDTPLDLTDEAGVKDPVSGLYPGVRGKIASTSVSRGADGRTAKSKSVITLKDQSLTDGDEYISSKTRRQTATTHIYENRSDKPELTEPYGTLSIRKNAGDLYDGSKTIIVYNDGIGPSEAWSDKDDMEIWDIETKDGPWETIDGYRWRYKKTTIDISYHTSEKNGYDAIGGGLTGSGVKEAMNNLIWRSVKVKKIEYGAWQTESLSGIVHPNSSYWTNPPT